MAKAQAAMEFLMSYGWAILIVIVAIGTLTYSGVLGGAAFLPEKCIISTGSGLYCEDFSASTQKVTLKLRNALTESVQITEASVSQDGNSCNLPLSESPVIIQADSSATLELTEGSTCLALTTPGEKLKGEISVTYIKKQLPRTTKGDMVVKPEEAPGDGGEVTVDTASSTSETNVESFSWSHTTGTEDNRLLVVGITFDNKDEKVVSSIKYGDVSLTHVRNDQNKDKVRTELWYLKNSSAGTNIIEITLSGKSKQIVAGAITFNGVDQTTPVLNSNGASGTEDPTITITSAVGDMVVDVIGQKTSGTLTVGDGQTEQWQTKINNKLTGAASTEPGATSVVMDWASPNKEWAISSTNINAAIG